MKKILTLVITFLSVNTVLASETTNNTTETFRIVAEAAKRAGQNPDNADGAAGKYLFNTFSRKAYDQVENSFNRSFSNTELEISGEGSDTNYSIYSVNPLFWLGKGHNLTFLQFSLLQHNKRGVMNIGIGNRTLSPQKHWITGLNAFYDRDVDYNHERGSIGVELKSSVFEVNANGYYALTKWKDGKNDSQERPNDGYDVEIGGQVPFIPSAKIFIKGWEWKGYDAVADVKGYNYSLEFSPPSNPNIVVTAGYKDYDSAALEDVTYGKITYRMVIGGPRRDTSRSARLISSKAFNSRPIEDRMIERVRRKDNLVIQSTFTNSAGGA
jgi:adhesin/invasin